MYTIYDDLLQPPGPDGGGLRKPFEFRPEVHDKMYPHILMLAYQFRSCDEGSILCGDLPLLLQAMRNRSIQPTRDIEEEGDEYDTSETEEEEFQFHSEKRFPVRERPRVEPDTETNSFIIQVLMISVIPPSHVRVYHACMNDSELLIRQTPTWSLEKRNDDLLDFLASCLLSTEASAWDGDGMFGDFSTRTESCLRIGA